MKGIGASDISRQLFFFILRAMLLFSDSTSAQHSFSTVMFNTRLFVTSHHATNPINHACAHFFGCSLRSSNVEGKKCAEQENHAPAHEAWKLARNLLESLSLSSPITWQKENKNAAFYLHFFAGSVSLNRKQLRRPPNNNKI